MGELAITNNLSRVLWRTLQESVRSFMKKFIGIICMSGLLSLSFSGCATLQSTQPTSSAEYFERYEAITSTAVQLAVVKLLNANPAYAQRVIDFSQWMKDVLRDENINVVDLSLLETLAKDRIDWSNYDPTERVLMNALIRQIRVELEHILEADCGTTTERLPCFADLPGAPEKVKMYGTKLLTWVHEGAALFVATQSRTIERIPTLP
jgi:hypothetical protein